MMSNEHKMQIPLPEQALPGRQEPLKVDRTHYVLQTPIQAPFPPEMEHALLGMGCFWGAEKRFWTLPGVYSTAVGYAAGFTPNPTYQEVCTGMTGHNEVVLVLFNPAELSYEAVLDVFWSAHNPTQGMRQGNDRGTQYRSGIYTFSEQQHATAIASQRRFQARLHAGGFGDITTEIQPAGQFYYAESYHQQYLAKNPQGYCGLGGTGV